MTRNLLRSEWRKVRSTRTTFWLLIALIGLELSTVVLPVVVAPVDNGRFALSGDFAQRTIACTGATVAGVVGIVLGVLGMAGEYRHRTLTGTLLISPRRGRVLRAKVVVHAAVGALIGVVATAVSIGAVLAGVHLRGVPTALSLADLAAIAIGGIVYVLLATLFGLGAGAVTGDPVTSLAGVLTLFFVIETVLAGVAPGVARWLPGQSGSALAFPAGPDGGTGLTGAHVLSQPVGSAVFGGYTVLVLLGAFLLTRDRDIV